MVELNLQDERRILLKRLFDSDRDLFEIGREMKIDWFDTFEGKFSKDDYAYFADEERKEALDIIINQSQDDLFVNAINTIYAKKERYSDIDIFVGRNYHFDKKSLVKHEDKRNELLEQTKRVLAETKGRTGYFLKAIIELHREEKWDKVYRGATWEDILAKIRALGGSYPSPRDLVILKSYKIYYKTGSRRYPTHTIPEEMIPIIEKALE